MRRAKKKLPDVFSGDNDLFAPATREGREAIGLWKFCRGLSGWCIGIGVGSFVLQWWWVMPILLFIGLMASGLADATESKANTGYPYLEHTDMIGILIGGMMLFAFCFVLFVISFWIPAPGWDFLATIVSG